MFFKTYRDNTERGRVFHYLRIKALEQVLEEGDNFHKKLESGEIRFGTDNQDMPFINARATAHGLERFYSKAVFCEDAHFVTKSVLERQLPWFLEQLTVEVLHAKNQQKQELEASQFAAAAQFVYELLHPTPTAAPVVSLTWADNDLMSG